MSIEFSKQKIGEMYSHYLEMNGLDENKMGDIQRVETRRAFIGGVSELFAFLLEIESNTIEEYDKIIADVRNEIYGFWLQETGKLN